MGKNIKATPRITDTRVDDDGVMHIYIDKRCYMPYFTGDVCIHFLDKKPKIGDVCKFWDYDENEFVISKLVRIHDDGERFYTLDNICYHNAKTISPQQVQELLFGKGG